ncbi:hypothetical protein NDU88_003974 [Pleurodeles waltl]|uniref:Uncharacterized protein n=1 Tax=Pleurodeles waltl TaxID=8319 RepID=A0AAV7TQ71_PLEWA|nr:hypothetical protein NDU88_003974 [Pleurodeles waltl]
MGRGLSASIEAFAALELLDVIGAWGSGGLWRGFPPALPGAHDTMHKPVLSPSPWVAAVMRLTNRSLVVPWGHFSKCSSAPGPQSGAH